MDFFTAFERINNIYIYIYIYICFPLQTKTALTIKGAPFIVGTILELLGSLWLSN